VGKRVALDVPVILGITKWDHWSKLENPENPAAELAKLDAFFDANQAHEGLRSVLQSSIVSGHFQVFPMSALGRNCWTRNDKNEVVEVPAQSDPLASFGLEDPFVWIVHQRDAMDLQEFRQNALKKYSVCHSTGKELLKRFPSKSETAKQVREILHECRRKQIRSIAIATAAVVFAWFTVETSLDLWQYRRHLSTLQKLEASPDEKFTAAQWFDRYSIAPAFRHLVSRRFLSREDAEKIAHEHQQHTEELHWQTVEAAQIQEAKLSAAKNYQDKYPEGPHAMQATSLIAQIQAQQQEEGYLKDWKVIQNELAGAENDSKKLQALLDRLAGLTHPFTHISNLL
jgi:hypothetical protein